MVEGKGEGVVDSRRAMATTVNVHVRITFMIKRSLVCLCEMVNPVFPWFHFWISHTIHDVQCECSPDPYMLRYLL
jgi:hypothetical protein